MKLNLDNEAHIDDVSLGEVWGSVLLFAGFSPYSVNEYYVINHIGKGEEKEFTFKLIYNEEESMYSSPKVFPSKPQILYRDNPNAEHKPNPMVYQAMDNEYEMNIAQDANGHITTVTITNTSEYQWEQAGINVEGASPYLGEYYLEGKNVHAGNQTNIGETITVDFIAGDGGTGYHGDFEYITRVLSVSFHPRGK